MAPNHGESGNIKLTRQKATTISLADEQNTTSSEPLSPTLGPVLERIRKCIARAQHEGTPELEAKTALHMASRLMTQFNISQAEAYAQGSNSGPTGQPEKRGGQSVVRIKPTDPAGKVIEQGFVMGVAAAMGTFFDCQTYSSSGFGYIDWVFYGIAPNTVAAAVAFEMSHNLILEWAKAKKGISARHSYTMGVSAGLGEMAESEKREEEKAAKRREEAELAARIAEEEVQQQREIDRLTYQPELEDDPAAADPFLHIIDLTGYNPSESDVDSDSDVADPTSDGGASDLKPMSEEPDSDGKAPDKETSHAYTINIQDSHFDNLDHTLDLDAELKRILNQHSIPPASNPTPPVPRTKTPEPQTVVWPSSMQLTCFRRTAIEVAEEYLQEQNVVFSKRQWTSTPARDSTAWREGKTDSRKIDVKRRRLEG
ncbi:MAG: hypothetical protein M1813_008980 [Trichoglossum hirsutum]|nr:MAG: hypothetical protein M1813_008980 [Trichoglossum hirsutum]